MTKVRPFFLIFGLAVAVSGAGCQTMVKAGAKTGKDGRAKGAKKIKMEEGEGVARDIVTYPGGDRTDWKVFELKQPGDVEIALKWKPARPGQDLAMNVFDENFKVKARVKPAKERSKSNKPRKDAEIANLDPGKYYIQIYASTRDAAGDYTVNVSWRPPRGVVVDPNVVKADIPNPPKLPALPTPSAEAQAKADCAADPKKCPACAPGQQPGTPPTCQVLPMCAPGQLPGSPPTCAEPPTCPPGVQPGTGGCVAAPVVLKPVPARIIQKNISGNDIIIILDKGTNQGIAKGQTGFVLIGRTVKPVNGGNFTITSVSEDEAQAKIRKLTIDELGENENVLINPPPPKGP
jgi:hypothetical protein